MDKKITHLFVYGSLLSGFQQAAYEYVSRYFSLVGEGKVRGKLFDLGSYPVAQPCEENSHLFGELYKIKNEDEFNYAIGQLDQYENVTVEEGETPLYRRELCKVNYNEKEINAWIYWYIGNVDGKPVFPGGRVADYLKMKNWI